MLKTFFRGLVPVMFSKRNGSPENPNNSLYSDDVLDVNSASKFPKFGAIWRASTLISTGVAKLPLDVYEKSASGREKVHNEQSVLLKYQPNSWQNAYYFKTNMTFSALFCGNAYAYIKRDKNFKIMEYIQLDSNSTYPVREGGKVSYVTNANNKLVRFEAWEIIHLRGIGDDLVGWSIKDLASVSFDSSVMAQKYSRNFFKNSARPGMIIEHPATLSEDAIQRLKKQWDSMHSGVDNAHKTAVLEEGAKANPFAMSAKDAMLIEGMQFSIVDVANWFNIPADRLNAKINTSYNSLEQQNQNYLSDTLDPWLIAWEQELYIKALPEAVKKTGNIYYEFNRAALVRADLKARSEYNKAALAGAAWETVNEVRRRSNLNDIAGGDVIVQPTNNFGNDTASANSARNAINHVVERMKDRVKKDTKCNAENILERHGKVIDKELAPVCEVYKSITGDDILQETKQQIIEG